MDAVLVLGDVSSRTLLCEAFLLAGYRVYEAADDETAQTVTARVSPALIVVELELLLLDEKLRERMGSYPAPVIVVSSRHDDVAENFALRSGASAFITQPFRMFDLLARVRAALGRRPATSKRRRSDSRVAPSTLV